MHSSDRHSSMSQTANNISLFNYSSYDAIITQDSEYVLKKFKKFNARIVFSAESTCWPDASLAVKSIFY